MDLHSKEIGYILMFVCLIFPYEPNATKMKQ